MFRELIGQKKPVLDKSKILHWPVLLLYPEVMSSDIIEDFSETDMFSCHLDIISFAAFLSMLFCVVSSCLLQMMMHYIVILSLCMIFFMVSSSHSSHICHNRGLGGNLCGYFVLLPLYFIGKFVSKCTRHFYWCWFLLAHFANLFLLLYVCNVLSIETCFQKVVRRCHGIRKMSTPVKALNYTLRYLPSLSSYYSFLRDIKMSCLPNS